MSGQVAPVLAQRLDALAASLTAARIVPVVTLDRVTDAVPLARALLAGGIGCLEITFRTAAAAASIAAVREAFPDLLVGAGTILAPGQADEALAAGASFVVAPGLNPRVVDHVLGLGLPMIPGVATPSEIESALERGLSLLKLFPAGPLGGPAYLRALAGPYPGVRFLPTGGIDAAALGDYLALPTVAAVGGTWVAPRATIEAGEWGLIERVARDARHAADAARRPG